MLKDCPLPRGNNLYIMGISNLYRLSISNMTKMYVTKLISYLLLRFHSITITCKQQKIPSESH